MPDPEDVTHDFDWCVEAVRKEHRDFEVYRLWDAMLLGGMDCSEFMGGASGTQSQVRATKGGKAR